MNNGTMRDIMRGDIRQNQLRKQIEEDIKFKNEYIQRTLSETSKWHFRRKPYNGVYS